MSTELEEIINGLVPHFEILDIEFMIIGAMARDIISEQSGLPLSVRKTADVDFGVLVENWDNLEALRESFKKDMSIKESSNNENNVRYHFNGTPFDIVPFGGIEKAGKVSWPPFYDTVMTVVGYQEALKQAPEFKIGNHNVKVVTPEMLVALKIIAWDENPARQKDADDINFIIKNYERIDPDTDNYIWDNHEELPEKFEHDFSLAAIALMGIRISNYASKDHLNLIKGIFQKTELVSKLARDMLSGTPGPIDDTEVEKVEEKLKALFLGIEWQ